MRKANWEEEYYKKLNEAYSLTFAWGTLDCVTWSFQFANALLVDGNLSPGVTWSSEEEALALLNDLGMGARMNIIMNQIIKSPAMARRGDFVYYAPGGVNTQTLGICAGSKGIFLTSAGGIVTKNILDCVGCWRVD